MDGKQRLNPFALSSTINLNFYLLIIAVLVITISIVAHFFEYGLGFSTVPRLYQDPFLTEKIYIQDKQVYQEMVESQFELQQEFKVYLFFPVLISLGVTIINLGLAYYHYLRHPLRIKKQDNLNFLSREDNKTLSKVVQNLSDKVGLPAPQIALEGESYIKDGCSDGKVFGLQNNYILGFPKGIRLLLLKNPKNAYALILHELSHILNNDIRPTYFSKSLFKVMIIFITATIPLQLLSDFPFRSTSQIAQIAQIAIVIVLMFFTQRRIVRDREYYADWRASMFGAEEYLLKIFEQSNDRKNRFWEFHPSLNSRLNVLRNPFLLFKVPMSLPLIIGVLMGVTLSFLFQLAFDVSQIILHLIPMASIQIILTISIIFLLVFGVSLFVSSTLGLQVVREEIAQIALTQKQHSIISLFKTGFIGLVFSIGTLIGFAITPSPSSQLSIISLWNQVQNFYIFFYGEEYRLWMLFILEIIWLFGFTIFTWLWLNTSKDLWILFLSIHNGAAAPHKTVRRLIVLTAFLFSLFLVPSLGGKYMIAPIILLPWTATHLNSILGVALVLFVFPTLISLFLYIFTIATCWLINRCQTSKKSIHCPNCGQPTHDRSSLGKFCKHCKTNLTPWLLFKHAE